MNVSQQQKGLRQRKKIVGKKGKELKGRGGGRGKTIKDRLSGKREVSRNHEGKGNNGAGEEETSKQAPILLTIII